MNIKSTLGILLGACISTSFAVNSQATVKNAAYYINKLKINAAGPTPTTGIKPGMGYSSDTQNIAPAVCYAPLEYSRGGQSSSLNLTSNMSVQQIANTFGLRASLNGGYGEFAADAMVSYLREMQEDSYSLSLNYYQKVSSNMHVYYSYYEPTLFSEQGKSIYKNGQNPLFRLICGDTLVTDYDEGAALIMSIKIKFNSKLAKEEFSAKAGANFGSFLNASVNISQIDKQYNLEGIIDIKGDQFGGDPTRLAKMLSNNVVKCDIKNITACQQTAQALIDYARDDFPNQFSHNGGIWSGALVPLGGFTATYTLPDIGIPLPPTYVTPEVKQARDNLVKQKINTQTYVNNLGSILQDGVYPVPLVNNFKNQLQNALNTARNNKNIFDNSNTQAINCWLSPDQCPGIANSIISHLAPVNMPANFDEVFDNMRASGPGMMYGMFWPTGAGYCPNDSNCKIYYQEYTPPEMQGGFALINSTDASATKKNTIGGDGFVAHGTFHDGGDCPYSAGYSILNQTLTLGRGGCSQGKTVPYALEIKDNPFYFRVNR